MIKIIEIKTIYIKYCSADERFDGTYQTNIVVSNDGSMLYVPPGIFKSTCKVVDQLMIMMIFARNAKMLKWSDYFQEEKRQIALSD